jgi:hypothetical protein
MAFDFDAAVQARPLAWLAERAAHRAPSRVNG